MEQSPFDVAVEGMEAALVAFKRNLITEGELIDAFLGNGIMMVDLVNETSGIFIDEEDDD